MNEIQEVIDELRFILQRDVIAQSDELSDLVRRYSDHCHEVNARLRRCDEYLKQGLRSEALHLAQAAPNLLDAVAVLDFPELDELIEVVNIYFLMPPEPLLLDVAAALNSAYADHEPLEKLLDLHRLLAIGRGPLTHRLTVLRSLAELDFASPHWDLDIREMERARFRELDAESAVAARSGNTAVLKSLLSEIQADGWRESIPPSLARDLKARASQTSRGKARQRMLELNDQLYSAFSALDADGARPLRDEWNQAQRIVQVPDTDPICDQVAPIFAWLDDEDRKLSDSKTYTKVVADVERALEQEHVTAADLKRLQLAADRLERALPPILETRFRSRLRTAELIEGRRRTLFVGGCAAAVALLVGSVGFMMYLSVEGEKTRRVVTAVNTFIDEAKLDEAQKLIDQQSKGSTSEAWLEVKKKLSDAEQSERDRVLNWKTEIATARESTDAISVEAALKRARELTRSAEEKIELGQLQSTWQKRANEELAKRERAFREVIGTATASLKNLDTAIGSVDTDDADSLKPLLAAAESHIAQLNSLRNGIAKELSSQGTLLESRLIASRQSMADMTRKAELTAKITDAVLILPGGGIGTPGPGEYEAALRKFAEVFPKDPRSATMKAAAEISPLPAATARQDLMNRWKRFRPLDKKDVETRLRELRSFFTAHPQSPDRELLGQYELWLASVLRRFEEDGDPDEGVRQRLYSLFSNKFIKEGHILIDDQRRTYYLPKPLTTPYVNSKAAFTHLAGFNGETKKASMNPDQLLTPTSIDPPQKEIAEKVRRAIREVTLDGWRDYFQELSETLLKADKVDPFLRYLLVLKILEFAGRGDQLLEAELTPLLAKLNDDEIDRSVPWMDPTNEPAKAARTRAVELLAKIPPLPPLFANVTRRQEQFERELFARRFAVGWLEKTAKGDWVCRTKWTPSGDHELHVVSRPDPSGSRTWLSLGRIQGKSMTVVPEAAQSAGEASVVFASSPTVEAKTAQSQ